MKPTYKEIKEEDKSIKQHNWEIAIGLNEVDGLKPSKYLDELIDSSLEGSSYKEIEEKLIKYYETKDLSIEEIKNNRECDLVSTRIAEILEDGSFTFKPIYLKTIHKKLFEGVFEGELREWVGRFRETNIRKEEAILNGESVTYGNYLDILEYLQYDFSEEEKVDYTKLSIEEQVKKIGKFTSAIWQIHGFREGNTRTIAVFIEKYLRLMGYEVNNDLFKHNSLYFRNALVLSNYSNIPKNISPNFEYLHSFFRKLLIDKGLSLKEMEVRN